MKLRGTEGAAKLEHRMLSRPQSFRRLQGVCTMQTLGMRLKNPIPRGISLRTLSIQRVRRFGMINSTLGKEVLKRPGPA
jgi:hypothetical protein